ncbi:MAG: phosphoribosylaminoimidazolesuccinocarboxamide synthase [Firmicutes bacterium]|nr:phosphoribosylaminoimidazolesuccinocarboxamide synthase [Bacillota bacterium]
METAKLYEGKAKVVLADREDGFVRMVFKDDATADNGLKRGRIADKGRMNRDISAALFRYLEAHGIPTHYVEAAGEREMRVRRLRMLPLEFVVRNTAAGSLARRLGLPEGQELGRVVVEIYLKNDALGDPLINRDHIRALGLADDGDVDRAIELARRTNDLLRPLLLSCGLRLIDFKLEFGVDAKGEVRLGDEISPDTCRFWDAATGTRLDKDRFRRDMGGVEEAYAEVLRRVDAAVGGAA